MFENIAPIFKDEFTHDTVSFIYLGSTFKLNSILYLTLQSAFLPLTLSKSLKLTFGSHKEIGKYLSWETPCLLIQSTK